MTVGTVQVKVLPGAGLEGRFQVVGRNDGRGFCYRKLKKPHSVECVQLVVGIRGRARAVELVELESVNRTRLPNVTKHALISAGV